MYSSTIKHPKGSYNLPRTAYYLYVVSQTCQRVETCRATRIDTEASKKVDSISTIA